MDDLEDARAFLDPPKKPARAPAKPTPAPVSPPAQVDPGAAYLGGQLAALRAAVDQLRADTTHEVAQLRAELKASHPDAKVLQGLVVQAGAQAGRTAADQVLPRHQQALEGVSASRDEGQALRDPLEAQGRLLWRLAVWVALPAVLLVLAGLLKAMATARTLASVWSVAIAVVFGFMIAVGSQLAVAEVAPMAGQPSPLEALERFPGAALAAPPGRWSAPRCARPKWRSSRRRRAGAPGRCP